MRKEGKVKRANEERGGRRGEESAMLVGSCVFASRGQKSLAWRAVCLCVCFRLKGVCVQACVCRGRVWGSKLCRC